MELHQTEFFFLSVKFVLYLTTSINVTNDKNTRVVWGYIYTIKKYASKPKFETFLSLILC